MSNDSHSLGVGYILWIFGFLGAHRQAQAIGQIIGFDAAQDDALLHQETIGIRGAPGSFSGKMNQYEIGGAVVGPEAQLADASGQPG